MADNIRLEIIPHKQQRYETIGDWFRTSPNRWTIRSSLLKNRRHSELILMHEFLEWRLCQIRKIKQRDCDQFDKDYEKFRADGKLTAACGCKIQEEPGDDIHAPYHECHVAASECEMILARYLDVDWLAYSEVVARL